MSVTGPLQVTTLQMNGMNYLQRQLWRLLPVASLLALVAGCSHPVAEFDLPGDTPETFSSNGPAPTGSAATEIVPAHWWRAFGDDALDRLIEQALASNFNLQTAWDRLVQAQAAADKTTAGLWPQANGSAGVGRSRRDAAGSVTYDTTYETGVAAGYEIDLWSRLRSQQTAAVLDVQAQQDALDTAAISLSALVANTWYQLADAKALIRITQQQIETNRQVLEVVSVQFRKGRVSAADVLRQRQLVASTESRLISARETAELLQYLLSVLIGAPPALAWEGASIELPDLPPQPQLGIPSEVLWRRPDVRLAYRQVQAADQRLAVAVADQYPRLSLAANAETSAGSVGDLFDDSFANLVGNAVQPLFDAGLRKAEVERRKAIVSEVIHNWRQTILEALQEIEVALTQERRQGEFLDSLQTQLDLARQTYDRNRDRYTKGQTDYLRVLESLSSTQALERELVRARATLIERRIDLYRSIAGGWELPEPLPLEVDDLKQTTADAGHTGRDG